MQRLVRMKQTVEMTGRSRSRLYDDMKHGKFPKPVKIGPRAIAWPLAEVQAWIDAQIANRDA